MNRPILLLIDRITTLWTKCSVYTSKYEVFCLSMGNGLSPCSMEVDD